MYMLDHMSQSHGELVDLTTDGVIARDRIDYWRDAVLRRTRPEVVRNEQQFGARLRRIVLADVELIEHASDGIVSSRAAGRTRFEGGDDIALELMRSGTSNLTHNGEHRLKAGDLWLVDYAQPFRTERSRHRACGIVLSRRRVHDVLGRDLSRLGGHRVPARGLAAVVRAHMTAALDEAPHMTREQRVSAMNAVTGMVLVVLQGARFGAVDADRLGEGLYQAALAVIERACVDPALTPERIALAIGCSRATLYRLFSKNDKGVAEAVWQARLERVRRELCSATGIGMTVGDIALDSGFVDLSSFSRMFKRRYSIAPQELRRAWFVSEVRRRTAGE
jgi:AraC-like DNA-binding protein